MLACTSGIPMKPALEKVAAKHSIPEFLKKTKPKTAAMSRVNAAIPKLIISSFIFSSEYSIRKLLMSVDGITAQGSRWA